MEPSCRRWLRHAISNGSNDLGREDNDMNRDMKSRDGKSEFIREIRLVTGKGADLARRGRERKNEGRVYPIGTIKEYRKNNLLLTMDDKQVQLLRDPSTKLPHGSGQALAKNDRVASLKPGM